METPGGMENTWWDGIRTDLVENLSKSNKRPGTTI